MMIDDDEALLRHPLVANAFAKLPPEQRERGEGMLRDQLATIRRLRARHKDGRHVAPLWLKPPAEQLMEQASVLRGPAVPNSSVVEGDTVDPVWTVFAAAAEAVEGDALG